MARFDWLRAEHPFRNRLRRAGAIRGLLPRLALPGLLCWALSGALAWAQVDPRATPEAASPWQDKPAQIFSSRAIVTAHPLATHAGWQILRQGGSAVDAAIAAQLVLTLVEPQSSGLGGGGFLLLSQGGEVVALDGRETAPLEADESLFLLTDGTPMPWAQAVPGGRSVGTPGVLRLLELAHQQHGRLPWRRLVEPALQLATRGFPVSARLHQAIQDQAASLRQDPAAAAYFLNPQGQAWPIGHPLRNPALARTLRLIAQHGADALYQGPLAQALVQRVRQHPVNPGRLSMDDLQRYIPWQDGPCESAACRRPARGGLRLRRFWGCWSARPCSKHCRRQPCCPRCPLCCGPISSPKPAAWRLPIVPPMWATRPSCPPPVVIGALL